MQLEKRYTQQKKCIKVDVQHELQNGVFYAGEKEVDQEIVETVNNDTMNRSRRREHEGRGRDNNKLGCVLLWIPQENYTGKTIEHKIPRLQKNKKKTNSMGENIA